ncbi:phosphodiester glycosidase family protein [Alicyclobacillus dauci]|uniref:Phosphodiester glycosidase family protein n=1 Tax=Alicyclobacillus dauci TaxID=1475485 RepID=A0ABY6YZ55_9BACL|nr:phosphodiester glycosidase family protein [Alicyclobacillus dauci]WAH35866.1 phosphodiester glycosidase family protein [Alicyclobacillus dauci]
MRDHHSTGNPRSQSPTRKDLRLMRAKRRKRRLAIAAVSIFSTLLVLVGGAIGIAFGTPFGNHLRLTAAETIASTRHYEWARYITTPQEFASILHNLDGIAVKSANIGDISVAAQATPQSISDKSSGPVQLIPLDENGYTGYVMLVHDPKLVRLVPAQVQGSMGEYITNMGPRVGAVAGVNASGFEDPNGNGWGGVPVGLEYVNGQVMQQSKRDPSWATVGFTKDGIMVMGDYTTSDLKQLGVRDAMQFHPELVVNGQPTITEGDGGWGSDPRTAIGQEKDGTVIFVVVNGRLHGNGSMGATQRQVMDIMLRYHAVNACAMDGGSSSVLYNNGQIINSPSTIDPHHERHLPDAWMVFPTEQAANHVGD